VDEDVGEQSAGERDRREKRKEEGRGKERGNKTSHPGRPTGGRCDVGVDRQAG